MQCETNAKSDRQCTRSAEYKVFYEAPNTHALFNLCAPCTISTLTHTPSNHHFTSLVITPLEVNAK